MWNGAVNIVRNGRVRCAKLYTAKFRSQDACNACNPGSASKYDK